MQRTCSREIAFSAKRAALRNFIAISELLNQQGSKQDGFNRMV
jgi:hypothetical protein